MNRSTVMGKFSWVGSRSWARLRGRPAARARRAVPLRTARSTGSAGWRPPQSRSRNERPPAWSRACARRAWDSAKPARAAQVTSVVRNGCSPPFILAAHGLNARARQRDFGRRQGNRRSRRSGGLGTAARFSGCVGLLDARRRNGQRNDSSPAALPLGARAANRLSPGDDGPRDVRPVGGG